MQNAPIKDREIPKNWIEVVLVLKINHEKKIIRTGVVEAIKEELMTRVVFKEIYVKELKIVIPKIERTIIKKIF